MQNPFPENTRQVVQSFPKGNVGPWWWYIETEPYSDMTKEQAEYAANAINQHEKLVAERDRLSARVGEREAEVSGWQSRYGH